MPQNLDAEEPRAGYFYIVLFILVLLAIVFGLVHYLANLHV